MKKPGLKIDVKALEKTIKPVRRWSFEARFSESFRPNLTCRQSISLAYDTFMKLGWIVTYLAPESIEAQRTTKLKRVTETIVATYENGELTILSKSRIWGQDQSNTILNESVCL